MNALRELNRLLSPVLPVETGVFSRAAPETYAVLTPLVDLDDLFGEEETYDRENPHGPS